MEKFNEGWRFPPARIIPKFERDPYRGEEKPELPTPDFQCEARVNFKRGVDKVNGIQIMQISYSCDRCVLRGTLLPGNIEFSRAEEQARSFFKRICGKWRESLTGAEKDDSMPDRFLPPSLQK